MFLISYPISLLKTRFAWIALICSISALNVLPMYGQNKSTQSDGTKGVFGSVIDKETSESLNGTTIIIRDSKGSVVGGGIAKRKGEFDIDVKPGSYTLVAKFIGYDSTKKDITVPASGTLNVGIIELVQSSVKEGEVVVEDKAIRMEVKGDTVEFRANQYKTDKNASADELVSKMPGIEIQNGQVKAQGQDVKRVLVDGKPFFGDDPNLTLKNLPSEIIDRVQVFDQMSDQASFTRFDDGERNKTLNIVTKEDRRKGQFGKLYAGYGDQDRYTAGGNINYFKGSTRISVLGLSNNINQQNFSIQDIMGAMGGGGMMQQMMGNTMRMFSGGSQQGGGGRGMMGFGGGGASNFLVGQSDGITASNGFGLNYNDDFGKTFSLSGSYFFNRSNNQQLQSTQRQTFIEDLTQSTIQNNNNTNINLNHRLNLRADWQLDSVSSILVTPSFTWQTTDRTSLATANTRQRDTALNSSLQNNVSDSKAYNISTNALYRLRLSNDGRTFSINGNVNARNNTGNQDNQTLNRFFGSTLPGRDSINFLQEIPSDGKNFTVGGNASYTEPITKNQLLQLTYNFNSTLSENNRSVLGLDTTTNQVTLLNPTLSNNASSQYVTHRPGASYKFTIEPEKDTSQSSGMNEAGMMRMMFGGMRPPGSGGGGMGGGFGSVGAWNITIGVDYQLATLSVDQTFPGVFNTSRTFQNILPSLTVNTRPTMFSNFRFNYRASTNQPSINQLQDVLDVTNPLRLSTGNSNLAQEVSHSINANYGTFNMKSAAAFFANISFNYTQDKIVQSTRVAGGTPVQINGSPIPLQPGAQFSRPVNTEGYWNTNAFATYSFPVEPFKGLKVNLSANVFANYLRDISFINEQENIAHTTTLTPAFAIGSNISENTDFSISYRTAFNSVTNTIQSQLNQQFYTHTVTARATLINKDTSSDFFNGWLVSGDFSYVLTTGLASGFNQGIPLLNIGLGKRVLDGRGEIKLQVFDALNQNNSINRNVGSGYVEDVQTNVLRRFFMLNFTYNLRIFN
jgi:hypothetical protein